ncbi:MAG TPA: DUF5615 family PIN-like protein [Tepidisphaeraceae bacterium]|jgi:hypothetical protein|nr:DUF5615 family PIN-like protein [Tepidisphaeraceae bacterium]
MKLLLDECVPAPLRRHLRPHNVRTTAQAGWSGIRNSTLLKLAAGEGFQAFITTDRGFEHQQNLSTLPLPVIILIGKSNDVNDLLPLIPKLIQALGSLSPGVTRIS